MFDEDKFEFLNRKILAFTVWQRLWHRPWHWLGSVLRKNVRQRWKPFLSEEHKTYTNLGWNSVTDFWLIMSLMNLAGSFYAGAKPFVSVTIRPMILILFDMIFYPMATYIIFIELIYWTNTYCQFFSTIKATFFNFQTKYSVPTLCYNHIRYPGIYVYTTSSAPQKRVEEHSG